MTLAFLIRSPMPLGFEQSLSIQTGPGGHRGYAELARVEVPLPNGEVLPVIRMVKSASIQPLD